MKSNEGSIVRCISILYRYGQSYIAKRLEYLNIGSGQYVFLMTLFRKGGISQEELSNHLKIDKGTTAKAIKKLEEEGYLVRNPDLRDKRAYKISLTPKALEVIPAIQAAAKDWENLITSGLSEEESSRVEQILQRMAENTCHFKIEDEENGK
ncbi:MarR family transcriptional regulator [Desulfosporosinus sp. BG]|uniref:MarR family winged helix-turn-helix transcriptional regulator n=1 Tax=Desulfosporosinus sp. BG TaxID=1633135 RepID=UPI00083B60EA|nr:MarR family transcriptional regulator [Desulfosporosinus sp. BG]